jgi:hypothetical protein
MYGIDVSPTLISNVTEAVMEEVKAWQSRPLDEVYRKRPRITGASQGPIREIGP